MSLKSSQSVYVGMNKPSLGACLRSLLELPASTSVFSLLSSSLSGVGECLLQYPHSVIRSDLKQLSKFKQKLQWGWKTSCILSPGNSCCLVRISFIPLERLMLRGKDNNHPSFFNYTIEMKEVITEV